MPQLKLMIIKKHCQLCRVMRKPVTCIGENQLSAVAVGHGRKSRRPVFSRRCSNITGIVKYDEAALQQGTLVSIKLRIVRGLKPTVPALCSEQDTKTVV